MTPDDTWHAPPDVVGRYWAGELGHVMAASVEAHLLACDRCRAQMAGWVPEERLTRNLDAILVRLDDRVPVGERLLARLGIPERISRILAVTPSAKVAWLTAITFVAVAAGAAGDVATTDERTTFAFLVASPLMPLALVASTFAGRSDRAREVVAATPMPTLDLLLVRAIAVLVPAGIALLIASLLVPGAAGGDALWLLPALGLASTSLALSTLVPVGRAAWSLGAVWVGAALISVRGAPRTDVIAHFAAFRPAGQLGFVALTLVAAAVVVVRREAFEHLGRGDLR